MATMTVTEAYTILGVTTTATDSDIKSAWRTLVRRYHPDNQVTGDRTAFERVQAAYDVLRAQSKTIEYETVSASPFDHFTHWTTFRTKPSSSQSGTICSACHGTGFVSNVIHIGLTSTTTIRLCSTCGGRAQKTVCSVCLGKGYSEYHAGFMTIKIACPACQ